MVRARVKPAPPLPPVRRCPEPALRAQMSPIDIVSSCDAERLQLEEQADEMAANGEGLEDGTLEGLYERLEELDASTVEKRAGEILYGLGFTAETVLKPSSEFSGGWLVLAHFAA